MYWYFGLNPTRFYASMNRALNHVSKGGVGKKTQKPCGFKCTAWNVIKVLLLSQLQLMEIQTCIQILRCLKSLQPFYVKNTNTFFIFFLCFFKIERKMTFSAETILQIGCILKEFAFIFIFIHIFINKKNKKKTKYIYI